jgi:hypothetical protein
MLLHDKTAELQEGKTQQPQKMGKYGRSVREAKCGWHSLHGDQADSQTVYFQSSLSNITLTKMRVRAKSTLLKTPSG